MGHPDSICQNHLLYSNSYRIEPILCIRKSRPVVQVVGIESLSCVEFGDLSLGPMAPESKLRIMWQGILGSGLFFLPRLHECL